MNDKIAVIIVTYNNYRGLVKLLDSLRSQEFKINEIVVIDNASTDGTNSVLKQNYPDITCLRMETNIGSAGGYYEGIKYASGDNTLLWTLDDDLSIFPDTLLKLVEAFHLLNIKEKIGAVRCVINPDSRSFYEIDNFAWRGTLINCAAIKEIGYPQKDYFLYAEDMEYSMRLVKAGYKLYHVSSSKMAFNRQNQTNYRILLGGEVSFYNEPFRLYYSIRNETAIYLRHRLYFKLFFLSGYAIKIILCLLKYPIDKKGKYLSAIFSGFSHGIISKLGKNNKFLPEVKTVTTV